MDSPEYKALVKCGPSLQQLIKHSYRSLTPSLLSNGLISEDTEEKTRLNSSGSDIAGLILQNVRSSIKSDPSLYSKFLESMSVEEKYYESVKEKLEDAKREEQQKTQVDILERDLCYSGSNEGDDDVFYSSTATGSLESSSKCIDDRMEESYNQEKDVVKVAGIIQDVIKLKSLAMLMEMTNRDWDYIMSGGPTGRKSDRLAELWVKKKKKDSLAFLSKLLIQPAINERRLSSQISRELSGNSEIASINSPYSSLTSSVELDWSEQKTQTDFETLSCTKQNVLNYLAQYSADWEEIGEHLIGHNDVEKIKMSVEMQSDPIPYLVEQWWKVTTDESSDFSWNRLNKAIQEVSDMKQEVTIAGTTQRSYLIEDLYHEFEEMGREYCKSLTTNRNKCDDFCRLMLKLPQRWRGLDKYYQDLIGNLKARFNYTDEDVVSKDDPKDSCIEDFFEEVKDRLWNFVDHGFFGYLIRRCGGSKDLQRRMENYEAKVEEMCRETTIDEFIHKWDPVFEDDIPEDIHRSVMKLDWNPKEHSISELKAKHIRCRERVTQKIVMAASVIAETFSGSIIVSWLIFIAQEDLPQLKINILNQFQENLYFFERQEVSFFSLDDFITFPNTKQNILWNATREGKQEEVEGLLKDHDLNIDHIYEISQRTVLQCAAKHGHMDVVNLLLTYGADIDYRDHKGYTALMIALRSYKKDMADLLIWNGANIDIQDKIWSMSPLLLAAKQNDAIMIQKFLEKNASLTVRNKNMKTALILAAECGHDKVVRVIMEHCDTDIYQLVCAQDIHDRTALHAAVMSGNIKIVRMLILHSEIIGIKDENDKTALDIAETLGHEEIVSLLLGEKDAANIEQAYHQDSPLSEIKPESEEQEELSILTLEKDEDSGAVGSDGVGAELSDIYQQDTKKQEKKKRFELFKARAVRLIQTFRRTDDFKFVEAAAEGQNEVVLDFLEKKHDPNRPKPDKQNWTALMWACRRGKLDTVKILLDHGADVNITSDNWFAPLMIASNEGHYEIVKVLLQNKQKPIISAVNEATGWCALMWASAKKRSKEYTQEQITENHFKIAKELVAAGADVNQEAKNGWTPLMQASQDGHIELVKFLCNQENIKLNHQCKSSWSALTIACLYNQEAIAKILVDAKADITMKKRGGITALHIACFKGSIGIVKHMVPPLKSLQQHRININIVDDWGMTPLTLAMKAKRKEVVEYLVQEARADVNIRAEKYLKWSAIFFALQNKDLDSYRLLVANNANTEYKDEYGYSLEAIGVGTYLSGPFRKQFHKEFIKEKRKKLGMESRPSLPPPPSPLDTMKYYTKEISWRSEQRPHLVSAR